MIMVKRWCKKPDPNSKTVHGIEPNYRDDGSCEVHDCLYVFYRLVVGWNDIAQALGVVMEQERPEPTAADKNRFFLKTSEAGFKFRHRHA